MRLPVIVGMGGVNAAGRSSGFQSYQRMVLSALPESLQQRTVSSLAVMMGLASFDGKGGYQLSGEQAGSTLSVAQLAGITQQQVLHGTLVRRVEPSYFDVDHLFWQSNGVLQAAQPGAAQQFVLAINQLPATIPPHWTVQAHDEKHVLITVEGDMAVKMDNTRDFPFKAAGQLPSGFALEQLYNSRFQPRGLQMALFGATDALRSTGMSWDAIMENINPDQVGVYSSSGFGQMDSSGYGGMHQARMRGERVTTKALAMGINSMPTDFINAYVLANVGIASSSVAACATFLSNLRHAVSDLQAGKVRVAMVGNSEAPICPELMDGFGTMGALATDENMLKLYGGEEVDHRRASRPFGVNCGFTIGEASQYFILMDDELALELGAPCLGSVTDVFINADGIKKSITAPGPGNHITMSKAVASATAIAGEEAIQHGSFVMAHGSSTPQNRVTESQIFDQVAGTFGISNWPVVAVKAYVGHTIAPASGDQLAAALGSFQHGILPGIATIDEVADDVHQDRLQIQKEHIQSAPEELQVAILNSKGFGGNNASSVILSPARTQAMLAKRYGKQRFTEYQKKREARIENVAGYVERADRGDYAPIYRFGEGMIADEDIHIDRESLKINGLNNSIKLPTDNPYHDMS